jgi:hypothetical protein
MGIFSIFIMSVLQKITLNYKTNPSLSSLRNFNWPICRYSRGRLIIGLLKSRKPIDYNFQFITYLNSMPLPLRKTAAQSNIKQLTIAGMPAPGKDVMTPVFLVAAAATMRLNLSVIFIRQVKDAVIQQLYWTVYFARSNPTSKLEWCMTLVARSRSFLQNDISSTITFNK